MVLQIHFAFNWPAEKCEKIMKLRIDFCDTWGDFVKTNNLFTRVLRKRYDVEINDKPDFIFYGDGGHRHRLYTCPRIFFSGEATKPNFRECDFALTSHYLNDPRHLRLPLYVWYVKPEELIKTPTEPEQWLRQKKKFCAIVIRNHRARKRIDFFEHLNRHKQVDSGGAYLNNIGGPIGDGSVGKLEFLRPYKFNIAFENRSQPGYTTEKICEAMRARAIPVYWGSPRIADEFNSKSFLNYFDFPNEEALIKRMAEIDSNDELYLEYLRQPYFHDNFPNEYFNEERLLDFFEHVLHGKTRPVGSRRAFFHFGRWIFVKKDRARP
jgi:hypothetical protein